jgi:hypothetical protein
MRKARAQQSSERLEPQNLEFLAPTIPTTHSYHVSVAVQSRAGVPGLEDMLLVQVEQWLAQCDTFRVWFHQNFRLGHPSPEQELLADKIQPWMIRFTRALISQVSDPELPHPHLARLLEATLWQLQEDWEARSNPIDQTEAERVLQTAFPTDPADAP